MIFGLEELFSFTMPSNYDAMATGMAICPTAI